MNDYYEYYNPIILISGYGVISPDSASTGVKDMGCKRVMILSDRENNKSGQVDIVRKSIAVGGVSIGGVFIDIPNDISSQTVAKIANLCRVNSCDSIVAVGGLKVLDAAKCVRLLISQNANDIEDLQGYDMCRVGNRMPLIIIPTICAIAGEASNVSVLKDKSGEKKIEFISEELFPHSIIIDAKMVVNQSREKILLSAFDAITNAIECVCGAQRNAISTRQSCFAIKDIRNYLEKCLEDTSDGESLQQLLRASTIAGVAQSSSMLGRIHGISYGLSVELGVSNIDCVAEVLPYMLKYNYDKWKKMYEMLYFYIVEEDTYLSTPKEHRAKAFYLYIRQWFLRLSEKIGGLPTIAEMGLNPDMFDKIIKRTLIEGAGLTNPLYNNTVDIHNMLSDIYGGVL